ncbi:ester cyclase [Pigmentibacter sp. JX0631]|uniref:ester cyclase n=1 Tax=Pigmentibacter sp. JX0631 TaxID=2976982 RepID=UPI002468455B|nr:ester cyclase [Pigmentibacter sp. JX0631]WGL58520.1 ester cyclase [Pigmentibacter sp. JX0631]
MNHKEAKALIHNYYDMLNKPQTKDLRTLRSNLSEKWRSFSGENASKGKEEFLGQVTGFAKLITELEWKVLKILFDGNKIVVRSEAKVTPVGNLFEVPKTGKSFCIMIIDIHTIGDRKFLSDCHVEDWDGALKQLTSK